MEMAGRSYSSGEWSVRAGSEEEFVERWTTFIEWSLDNEKGAESFVLVRSTQEPRKLLSLGAWENQDTERTGHRLQVSRYSKIASWPSCSRLREPNSTHLTVGRYAGSFRDRRRPRGRWPSLRPTIHPVLLDALGPI